jgi:hypothetical protein
LLRLTREHRGIENRVFHVRDVTDGEDPCRVRTGAAPMILSTLRNVTLNLLRWNNVRNVAAALRRRIAPADIPADRRAAQERMRSCLEALALIRPDG